MSWLVTVAVLGFDLERGRRLAHDHPPPPSLPPTPPSPPSPPPISPPYAGCDYVEGGRSCDEDYTNSCDEQSEDGRWDRSCDLHPSKGCDDWSGCKYDPPPPLAPAPPGGYSPPPEPPPEDDPVPRILFWSLLGTVLLLTLVCICVYNHYRSLDTHNGERGSYSYLFFCCIECCRPSYWNHADSDRPVGTTRSRPLTLQEEDARNNELAEILANQAKATTALPALRLAT